MSGLIEAVLQYLQTLAAAVLVGKVVLLSFVVAPVLAKHLEREPFGNVVRQLFPAYYGLGMLSAALGLFSVTALALMRGFSLWCLAPGGIWLMILAAESYCRGHWSLPLDRWRMYRHRRSAGATHRRGRWDFGCPSETIRPEWLP